MYAIIRTGGKQAKVAEGDVIDVELLHADGEVEFTPLLVVDGKGKVFSGRDKLTVTTEIVGDSTGPKIDIFKYKNKTGYRRRAGHRQKYTRLEVKKIEVPGAKKKASADAAGEKESVESDMKAKEVKKAKAEKKPASPEAKTEKKEG